VPAKAAFGMPQWLEEEITKRKLQAIEDISHIGEEALYDYVGGYDGEPFYLER